MLWRKGRQVNESQRVDGYIKRAVGEKSAITLIDWFLSYAWAGGPPIDMKMGLSCACTLMERGRRRSVYTLDEVRPFLSLIGNARFEPICVAPLLPEAGAGST